MIGRVPRLTASSSATCKAVTRSRLEGWVSDGCGRLAAISSSGRVSGCAANSCTTLIGKSWGGTYPAPGLVACDTRVNTHCCNNGSMAEIRTSAEAMAMFPANCAPAASAASSRTRLQWFTA
ncbi:hypothetical protein D9M71_721240 [compost metagenome]